MKSKGCVAAILLLLFACNSLQKEGKKDDTISIEINKEGRFIVSDKVVSDGTLYDFLLEEIQKIEEVGYQRDEIVADVRIHPDVKMVQVSDLQEILRNLEIKKVLYSNISKENAGRSI